VDQELDGGSSFSYFIKSGKGNAHLVTYPLHVNDYLVRLFIKKYA